MTVDVDWKKVSNLREEGFQTLMQRFRLNLECHCSDAAEQIHRASRDSLSAWREELATIEKQARHYKEVFRAKQNAAQKETSANVQSAVGTYETAIEVAKFTRDASAGTLLIGASLLSGGAALGVLGAGSTLKGAAKYQDTGNAGAAVLEFGLTFTLGIIPGPAANMARGEKVALFIATAQIEAGGHVAMGLIEGKSIEEALTNAAVEVTVGKLVEVGFKQVIQLDSVKSEIQKLTFPGMLKVAGTSVAFTAGSRLRGSAVSAAFQAPKRNGAGGPKQLDERILIGEPCLADLAIMGPDQCSTRPRF